MRVSSLMLSNRRCMKLKAEFPTRDGARTGAEELKKRFPMLQIRIFDAQTQTREDVELS